MSYFTRKHRQTKSNNELILQIDKMVDEKILTQNLTKRNINYITRNNETVLIKAIRNKYSENFIKKIIARSKKTTLSIRNKKGNSCLDYLMMNSNKYESILSELLKNDIPFDQENLLPLLTRNQVHIFKNYFKKIDNPDQLIKKITKNMKEYNCMNILELNTDTEKLLDLENVFEAMRDKIPPNKLLLLIEGDHECKLQGLEYLIKHNLQDHVININNLDNLLNILVSYNDLSQKMIDNLINSYKKNNFLDPLKIIDHHNISKKNKIKYLHLLNCEDIYNLLLNYKWSSQKDIDNVIHDKIVSENTKIKLDYFIIYQMINNHLPHKYLENILVHNALQIGKKVKCLLNKIMSDKISFRYIERFLINYIEIFKNNQKYLIKICKFIPNIAFSPLAMNCLLKYVGKHRGKNIMSLNDVVKIIWKNIYDSNIVCALLTKFIKFKYISVLIHNVPNLSPNTFSEIIKGYQENKYYKIFVSILNQNHCQNYLKYIKILMPYINLKEQIYRPGIMKSKSMANRIVKYVIYDAEYIHNFIFPQINPHDRIFSGSFAMLTLLEKYIEILTDHKSGQLCKLIEKIINNTTEFDVHTHLNLNTLITRNFLPDETIRRIINGFKGDIIPKIYGHFNSIKIEINAMSIFQDLDKYMKSDKYLNSRWTIKYTGQAGIDGGGIIKDFYCGLGEEIKSHMEVVDHHYYINHKTKNDLALWFKIGLLFGKMLAIDRLPCGINLHPYLLYRITHPELISESTKLIDFNDYWYHDIPLIKNISKLLKLNDSEWNNYLVDFGDNENDRLKHCTNRVIEIYESNYQPALNEFINGFWLTADSTKLKFIPQPLVGEKICGVVKYKITGMENGSLEKNLNRNNIDGTYFRSFLSTLDEINKKDPTMIKKLYQFWMGSPYLNLEFYKPSITYSRYQNVLEAHTCSLELCIPHPDTMTEDIFKDTDRLSSLIQTFIMNTINNQTIAESANLHTQYS